MSLFSAVKGLLARTGSAVDSETMKLRVRSYCRTANRDGDAPILSMGGRF